MWNDADKTIFDIFDLLNRNDRAPLKCPVCGKKDAHLYMYRWKEKKMGVSGYGAVSVKQVVMKEYNCLTGGKMQQ